MPIGHTRLISSNDDASIKKLAVVTQDRGFLMTPLVPKAVMTWTQVGDSTKDDIQTLSLDSQITASVNITGGFKLSIGGKTTINVGSNPTASYLKGALTTIGYSSIDVTGGPLQTADLVLTTPTAVQDEITITEQTMAIKPLRWLPAVTLVDFVDGINTSTLYSTVPLQSTQCLYLTATPTTGQVILRLQTPTGQQQMQPLGPKATAKEFLAAMSSISGLNTASYEVYGGPWPKPIIVQFKNSLQYQSIYQFSTLTNSFDKSAVVTVSPIGKQVLVTYNSIAKIYVIVRPGYM